MESIYRIGSLPYDYHHKESVNAHVEFEHRKRVARVAIVPHEDLERHHRWRVEQEDAADQEHACKKLPLNTTKLAADAENTANLAPLYGVGENR